MVRTLSAQIVCIWFAVWAFRKRYEVDETLDATMKIVRWSVVVLGFALVDVLGQRWAVLRVASGFTALGFLCWPNFAFYSVRLVRSIAGRHRANENRNTE
jgi:hypothetical protein